MDLRVLRPMLQDVVADLEKTLPYAAVLAQETYGERLLVDSREARAEALPTTRGLVLTVFTGRSFLEYALNDLSRPGLCSRLAEASRTLLAQALTEGIVDLGLTIDPGSPLQQDFTVPEAVPTASLPLACKMTDVTALRDRLQAADPRVANATALYAFQRVTELFVNRSRSLYQDLPRTQMVAQLVLHADGRSARLHTGHCYQGGYEHAALSDAQIDKLVLDAGRILTAPRLTPGTFDCIFSPDFAGIFAHEAFGHGTEADLFLQQRSRGQAYLGKSVASDLVNLYDSPARPRQAGSFFFDHEGKLTQETQIIAHGILQRPLTDLNASLRLGLPRSPNGRRESYARKVYARMTNTYFGPGDHTLDQMLADIDQGYFLDHPSNGMEDPQGWGIQLEGLYAEEIRGGKLTGQVFSPVIVTGYVPDLLNSITMVGPTVEITGLGMCGKGHKEWVKVSDGGPYLRLKARLG